MCVCCHIKQKTAYEMRISDWSSDVCSSDRPPVPSPQPELPTMTTQPHSHIVKSHDEERNRVISEILRMGSMAAAQLEAALDVLERRADKADERIIGNDSEIDKLEREISQDARTLAPHGPPGAEERRA